MSACNCDGFCRDCEYWAEEEAREFASLAATDPGDGKSRDDWECEQGAIDRLHDSAIALQALREAEALADWKEAGAVKESALRAVERAEADFLGKRLEYHRGNG